MYCELKKSSYSAAMDEINKAVGELFGYLSLHETIEKTELEQYLENTCRQFWQQCANRKLKQEIESMAAFPFPKRKLLYQAFQHDLDFTKHLEEETFCMQEKTLDPDLLWHIKNFMGTLYRSFFQNRGVAVGAKRITYQKLRHKVVTENKLNVCPACLMKEQGEQYWQMDHYLPQSRYPFLTFHPDNLSPLCIICNMQAKGGKDPLKRGDLTEVYVPYHRAAEQETEIAVKKIRGKKQITLVPKYSHPKIRTRIQNFEELYDLKTRWYGRFEDCLADLHSVADGMGMNRTQVEAYLERKEQEMQIKAKSHADMQIEAACSRFFAGAGRKEFLADWEIRRKEREALEAQKNET